MKITKVYKESANLEDLKQDKVIVVMDGIEYNELLIAMELMKIKSINYEIFKKFLNENEKRKVKWVK